MTDYHELELELSEAFKAIPHAPAGSLPSGLFRGSNFMTPEVFGYFRLTDGRWAEVSWGRGMGDYYLIGVTLRYPDHAGWPGGGGEVFTSPREAAEYLRPMLPLAGA